MIASLLVLRRQNSLESWSNPNRSLSHLEGIGNNFLSGFIICGHSKCTLRGFTGISPVETRVQRCIVYDTSGHLIVASWSRIYTVVSLEWIKAYDYIIQHTPCLSNNSPSRT